VILFVVYTAKQTYSCCQQATTFQKATATGLTCGKFSKTKEFKMKVFIGNYTDDGSPRQEDVFLDKWDSFNADHTIALIVAPLLQQLKLTKHGSGMVDDEDVPEELRSTSAPPKENEWDTDANLHKRWDWVLDEMIWAMTEHVDGTGDDKFFDHSEVDEEADLIEQIDKIKCDYEGLDAYNKRKQRGFELFGKYFQNLWD